jgi:hypothetical protein
MRIPVASFWSREGAWPCRGGSGKFNKALSGKSATNNVQSWAEDDSKMISTHKISVGKLWREGALLD